MSKRYNLTLHITDSDDNQIVDLYVNGKTMNTVQHLIRLSLPDFERVDPTPLMSTKKHRWGKSKQINPPIEPMEPTPEDIEDV